MINYRISKNNRITTLKVREQLQSIGAILQMICFSSKRQLCEYLKRLLKSFNFIKQHYKYKMLLLSNGTVFTVVKKKIGKDEDSAALARVENSAESNEENIRVICRFRPVNNKEKHEEKQQQLEELPITTNPPHYNHITVPRNDNKPPLDFDLDRVLWTDCSQSDAFEELAKPLVEQVIQGYNCTLFAFGQTGSGKTFTMFGPDNYRGPPKGKKKKGGKGGGGNNKCTK
ncbi:hypothetical protein RFI_14494 [Reticulomyxa filosa]|uniref:Kinesin motor domain-containing protein n=1 Tax=Reticulomyxa filosa TaxID=46433 RepID=X6NBK2_RETFI|nr:hypothetical protein RFI_14494 [Reticulomyxa filosa]|eukprot:ETO22702.1 hypothetical protein RFI_14494 [Reticulomyxa filosa]